MTGDDARGGAPPLPSVARAEARNFYYGFVLLPPERRAGIYAAYAFSRRADDSVDGDDPTRRPLVALACRREQLDACYAGDPPAGDRVLVALADTIPRFAIPGTTSTHLIEGVEMGSAVSALPRLSRRSRTTATGWRERWAW